MTDMKRGAVGHVHNCLKLPLDGSRDDEISSDMREFWDILGRLPMLLVMLVFGFRFNVMLVFVLM